MVKMLAVGLLLASLCGCSWSIGGSKQGPGGPTLVQPTRGQELIDLRKAHESGSITDAEYETQKARIMGR